MVRDIIYCMLSAICSLIAVNGLLTKILSVRKSFFLTIYLMVICFLTLDWGHISALLSIGSLVVLVSILSVEHGLFNMFLACLGYLINVTCNNIVLAALDCVFGISTPVILEEYLHVFSGLYCVLLCGIFYCLRRLLYEKLQISKLFLNLPRVTQYCLTANLLMYGVIFIVTISLGERIGYPTSVLTFNSILFVICMIVSSAAIFQSTKGVENEEKRKAQAKQMGILEDYVGNLENLVGEMQAFRHDYKNILVSMAGYIREGDLTELRVFFNRKLELPMGNSETQMKAWKYLRYIVPMELKGFLYEKLLLILTRNIKVEVHVSKHIEVSYQDIEDLIRILGVFIDNAVEEAETLPDGQIRLKIMKTERGVLFEIANNYGKVPEVNKMGAEPYTTKGEKRGNGLIWSERLIGQHEDMFHEFMVEQDEVIQRLEVYTR